MDSFVGRSQDVFAMKERRHKRTMFIMITIACVIVAAGIFALIINAFINIRYKGYETVNKIKLSESSSSKYVSYQNNILKYSRDGVSVMDDDGNELWNGSYNMTSPAIDIAGKYVVIADIGGKEFIVYNGQDSGTAITTDYPIVQASIAENGVTAVLLEETASNDIDIYNPYDVSSDRLLAEIPTNVDEGYPVCIDISPDGANVAASYVCVADADIQSRVAFYNFSDVGKNTNFLVGAKNYNNEMVSEVRYLNDNDVCIFGDSGFSVWTNFKKPEMRFQKKYNEEIKSAFCSDKYVGMILEKGGKNISYNMKVYKTSGKKVLDIDFDDEYNDVQINGNEIMMNSISQCTIYRINGVRRFSSIIDGRVLKFFQADGINRYYIVTDNFIEKIKLKRKK